MTPQGVSSTGCPGQPGPPIRWAIAHEGVEDDLGHTGAVLGTITFDGPVNESSTAERDDVRITRHPQVRHGESARQMSGGRDACGRTPPLRGSAASAS